MQIQKYKHWYYHRSNGTSSLVSEVLISFFCPSLSNSFHYFSSIMMGYFNFFLPVIPNFNVQTILWSSKEVSPWYHKYFWLFFERLCTLLCITGNIFPSVPSWLSVLILDQKQHSIVGYIFSPRIVWCTIVNNTPHSSSCQLGATGPYPPAPSTM